MGDRGLSVSVPREELQSVQRELEVLSEQYSQKCLENAHLAQALEAERQALRQCQRENQELNAHNQVSPVATGSRHTAEVALRVPGPECHVLCRPLPNTCCPQHADRNCLHVVTFAVTVAPAPL